jgi:hypothetical protein
MLSAVCAVAGLPDPLLAASVGAFEVCAFEPPLLSQAVIANELKATRRMP